MKKKERKRRDSNKFTNFLQYPLKKSHFKSQKPQNKTTSQKTKPMETENRKQRKTEHNKTNLVESRARRSIGGTVLSIKAFSKNFHRIGTLLSQQMQETSKSASSTEGKVTPAELKLEDNCKAQSRGSLPFCCATSVNSITLSHVPLSKDTAIFSH